MSDIAIERHGGVLELRLERPSKKNAINGPMYGLLMDGLAQAAEEGAVRAVLFTAAGDTFCAGNDLGDFLAVATAGGGAESLPAARFLEVLTRFPKPMVAAVQGSAVGIGTTMLLHCDLVYAGDQARFHVPFVGLGLVPEAASSLLLPRRVGYAVAAEMILLGAPLEPARARELGLVNAVLPSAELRDFALARAQDLARQPPQALRLSRALLRGDRADVEARIDEENRHFAACLVSPEAREAFTAFVQRRPPDFTPFE
jgi:enoyl-CoA hydratase/carnithine racemase